MRRLIFVFVLVFIFVLNVNAEKYFTDINYVKHNIEVTYIANTIHYAKWHGKSLTDYKVYDISNSKESIKYNYATKTLTYTISGKTNKSVTFDDIYVRVQKNGSNTVYTIYMEVGDNIYGVVQLNTIMNNGYGHTTIIDD